MNLDSTDIKLLLHFDGSDGSTTFTDEVSHTMTPAGDAQIDTAQSKFGGASGLFDGTGDYVNTDTDGTNFPFGTGDFTIAAWVRFNALSGRSTLTAHPTNAGGSAVFWARFDSDSQVCIGQSGGTLPTVTLDTTLATGAWYHMAWVRRSGTCRVFLDGRPQGADITSLSGVDFTQDAFQVAGISGVNLLNGWVDELVIAKRALFWTKFTPPTSAYSLVSAFAERRVSMAGMLVVAGEPANNTQLLLAEDGETVVFDVITSNHAALGLTDDDDTVSFITFSANDATLALDEDEETVAFELSTPANHAVLGLNEAEEDIFITLAASETQTAKFEDYYNVHAYVETEGSFDDSYNVQTILTLRGVFDASYRVDAFVTTEGDLDVTYDVQSTVTFDGLFDATYNVEATGTVTGLFDVSYNVSGIRFVTGVIEDTYNVLAFAPVQGLFDVTYNVLDYLEPRTYVMNVHNGAVSRYTNFDFLGYATVGGIVYGIKPAGLYKIGIQTLDDVGAEADVGGVDINCAVTTGLLDFGTSYMKRVEDLYIGGTFKADETFTVTVDGSDTYEYTFDDYAEQSYIRTMKTNLGKGLKGRYWTFSLEGTRFELDAMEVRPFKLSRRV